MGLRYIGIAILWFLLGGLLFTGLTPTAFAAEVCGTRISSEGLHGSRLREFATRLQIRYIDAFVNIVNYIEEQGRLPDCYLTKQQGRDAGWSPGKKLWSFRPGYAIGGDAFGNRERKLPKRYNYHYTEADLDYDGYKRGAKRLIYVRDKPGQGLIWITTDHYRSFHRIPKP
jgi:hypothetical protein